MGDWTRMKIQFLQPPLSQGVNPKWGEGMIFPNTFIQMLKNRGDMRDFYGTWQSPSTQQSKISKTGQSETIATLYHLLQIHIVNPKKMVSNISERSCRINGIMLLPHISPSADCQPRQPTNNISGLNHIVLGTLFHSGAPGTAWLQLSRKWQPGKEYYIHRHTSLQSRYLMSQSIASWHLGLCAEQTLIPSHFNH